MRQHKLSVNVPKILSTIFLLATIHLHHNAVAQLPSHIKPTPMQALDTIQQVVTTRTPHIQISKDNENNEVVYKGTFSYTDMQREPSFSWLPSGMDSYTPDTVATNYLQKTISNYKLLIFVGTWCEDSQNLLPKLFKILTTINISYENIMMVGMDRAKTTLGNEGTELATKYKATLLPTIILIDNNNEEVGRITETLNKSVEWDLVKIIGDAQK